MQAEIILSLGVVTAIALAALAALAAILLQALKNKLKAGERWCVCTYKVADRDLKRCMKCLLPLRDWNLFPAEWNPDFNYGAGEKVSYQRRRWKAMQSSTGVVPGTDALFWLEN